MQEETKNETVNHKFWVASSNFFETSLIFYPIYNSSVLQKEENQKINLSATLQVFDCEGVKVNEISCNFEPNRTSVIEVASLIESFKYEAGIKHGMIEVHVSPHMEVQCRINSHSNATVLGDLIEISKFQKAFLPLRIGDDVNTLMVVSNLSRDTNSIRSKLFLGKRSPELAIELAPGAVRVFSMNNEFAECFEGKTFSSLGYLRVTSRNDSPFALQVIECLEGKKEESIFSSIL